MRIPSFFRLLFDSISAFIASVVAFIAVYLWVKDYKITKADQGQFTIMDRDLNTPYIKKVRVVTTVTYSLKN